MPEQALDLGALDTALGEAGDPWVMGPTSMAALDESQRRRRLGVPLPPDLTAESIRAQTEPARRAVLAAPAADAGWPVRFDLRDRDGVDFTTPIRDQADCGSCVAFGVVATMEGVARFGANDPRLMIDLSEAHLFHCYGADTGASCDGGWYPEVACEAATRGIAREEHFPYRPFDRPCDVDRAWGGRCAWITGWSTLTGDPYAMKEWITGHGSLVACLTVFQDFFSYASGIYRHVTGDLAGGHCISLVGYDDAQACWIGKNSWGEMWGEGGWFRIGYGECQIEHYSVIGVRGVRTGRRPPTTDDRWLEPVLNMMMT